MNNSSLHADSCDCEIFHNILAQINSLASISHNIITGGESSIYIYDIANVLATIQKLSSEIER